MPPEIADASQDGQVSSGTASEALIAAATRLSEGGDADTGSDAGTGDTTDLTGVSRDPGHRAADASGQPDLSGSGGTQPPRRGDAPPNRIEAATRNARAAVEAEYAWTKDLGFLRGADPQQLRAAINIFHRLQNDSQGFYKWLGSQLQPETPAQDDDKPEAFPEGRLATQDGKDRAYAADQIPQLLEIHTRNIMRQLRPVLDATKRLEGRVQSADQIRETKTRADNALTYAREHFPYFKEHEKLIGETLMKIPEDVRAELGMENALQRAYSYVLKNSVIPGLDAAAEKRVRDKMRKQAAGGSGSAHPTDTQGTQAPPQVRQGDVDGLARRMEQMHADASATS